MLGICRSCLNVFKQLNNAKLGFKGNIAMYSQNLTSVNSHQLGKVLVEPQTSPEHNACVIFLHGSGDTGSGFKSWLEMTLGTSVTFAHIQLIFPTAPIQSYTPLMGADSHVWFDRMAITTSSKEVKKSVDIMAQKIYTFIEDELVAKGIPYDRIMIGGFSMGGAMALHVTYRYCPQIAGVFTLSSFLNFDSSVYEDLKTRRNLAVGSYLPPLFSCHGDQDDVVPFEEGQQTFKNLTALGVKGQFYKMKGMRHQLQKKSILMLFDWMKDSLKTD